MPTLFELKNDILAGREFRHVHWYNGLYYKYPVPLDKIHTITIEQALSDQWTLKPVEVMVTREILAEKWDKAVKILQYTECVESAHSLMFEELKRQFGF